MINKLSLRMRITVMVGVILILCSILLTSMVNISAKEKISLLDPAMVVGVMIPSTEMEETTSSIIIDGDVIYSKPIINIDEKSESAIQITNYALTPTVKQLNVESALLCLAMIVIGTVLTYYLSGKMLLPVSNLSMKIENLSENNLSEKLIVPKANDEISSLTKSYNTMTDRLLVAFENQKQFSANSAHELRTPLAVMQAKLDVFEKLDSENMADYKELVADMSKQVNRLSNLAVNLLEFNNVDTVELLDDIDVYPLVEEVVFDLEPVAKAKGVSVELKGDGFNVIGNDPLLYRAFYNIIENAIKYNKPNGKVQVDITNKCVRVKDNGIGIPDAMKENVFDAFIRVDSARSREMGGVGLGLYIANETFKKHNAIVEISNNKPKGTIFNIKF